ncbi:hypothetical protein IF1G_01294 [Cordyceps javanica]|uniref:Uncharacterized protein n=1 Tax=Cordyceps javanica TaxID=43265 RepID=A0A545VBV4_9HYPO|nr:hypothetical protein IF1G_01294 [Cordyceps javanica]
MLSDSFPDANHDLTCQKDREPMKVLARRRSWQGSRLHLHSYTHLAPVVQRAVFLLCSAAYVTVGVQAHKLRGKTYRSE